MKRIKANHNIELTYQPAVLNLIVSRCTEIESGGRMIDAILTNTVLPQISRELLSRATEDKQIFKIKIGVKIMTLHIVTNKILIYTITRILI